jgi:hypothetical protein
VILQKKLKTIIFSLFLIWILSNLFKSKFRNSTVTSLIEISEALKSLEMMKKMTLNCNQREENKRNITDITTFSKVLGSKKKMEWLELHFVQLCGNKPHLTDISELGRQLQNLTELKCLHLDLYFIIYSFHFLLI